MFPTVEVRWFYNGTLPERIISWFMGLAGPVEDPSQRTDHYLRGEQDDLGIKLREGRIEIKQLFRADGVVALSDRAVGRVEHWRKWGFALAEDSDFLTEKSELGWIAVEKTRRLRSYSVARNGAILPGMAGGSLSQGCEVELTQVEVVGESWWTVALEAYGKGAEKARILYLVGRYIFGRSTEHLFAARDSRSYPAWLAQRQGV